MCFTIKFKTRGYSFAFGHESKHHQQLCLFSIVEEFYDFGDNEMTFARTIFEI